MWRGGGRRGGGRRWSEWDTRLTKRQLTRRQASEWKWLSENINPPCIIHCNIVTSSFARLKKEKKWGKKVKKKKDKVQWPLGLASL